MTNDSMSISKEISYIAYIADNVASKSYGIDLDNLKPETKMAYATIFNEMSKRCTSLFEHFSGEVMRPEPESTWDTCENVDRQGGAYSHSELLEQAEGGWK